MESSTLGQRLAASRQVLEALTRVGDDQQVEQLAEALQTYRQDALARFAWAIINALPHESAAVRSLFGPLRKMPAGGGASFDAAVLMKDNGEEMHVVVAAVAGQGLTGAAMAVATMRARLPYLQSVLMLGIAAGQPRPDDPERDVWLGDIVVSENVVQYDHIKREAGGRITCRGDKLPTPSPMLLSTARTLKGEMEMRANNSAGGERWSWEAAIDLGVSLIDGADRPPPEADPLLTARTYPFDSPYRKGAGRPHLFIGTIGSANTLLKDPQFRDDLAKTHGTIAYEMEGAGVALAAETLSLQYIMVRGICDYADMNKNNDWQRYASVAAAGFSKVLLQQH